MQIGSVKVFLAALLGVAGTARPEALKPCVRFESKVQVTPRVLKRGVLARFALELVNPGPEGIRLLDVRRGRRQDLADTYYSLVVRRAKGPLIDGPRPISDPGPISEADFFVLEPKTPASLPVRSAFDLGALDPGSYIAYVAIWQDPYALDSVCRSGEVEFRVQQ
jgi:hypothetical protein